MESLSSGIFTPFNMSLLFLFPLSIFSMFFIHSLLNSNEKSQIRKNESSHSLFEKPVYDDLYGLNDNTSDDPYSSSFLKIGAKKVGRYSNGARKNLLRKLKKSLKMESSQNTNSQSSEKRQSNEWGEEIKSEKIGDGLDVKEMVSLRLIGGSVLD